MTAPEREEPDDPHGLIRQVLEMGESFPGPAGDVLLSWLLQLKDRIDPAAAARRLIERHRLPGPPFADNPRGRLIRLLHETATCSAERLESLAAGRRGGRRGRGQRRG
ncbi:MAG TPA: hypothetical protein VFA23_05350 [Dongiaceae bacterium]|nr:hypothetical protein [Dongiaceae bacterium]